MSRKARLDAPGALHHIICRGIERQKIFRDHQDRDDFGKRLRNILSQTSTRCYAWALLPDHFHLLLKTDQTPISHVMRRLLTGYAVSYNRRYRRHGHLFRNRYQSILCQEEPYLLELVRYIHLNPIRAKLVADLDELAWYPYSGHGPLVGQFAADWLETGEVLIRFGTGVATARKKYAAFVEEGIALGGRPELTGGGLARSAGGWQGVKESRGKSPKLQSDQRILGDSDFVGGVLKEAGEVLAGRDRHRRAGFDFDHLLRLAADLHGLEERDIITASKQPLRVQARSLLCYWAVRELGLSVTAVAAKLGMTQSAGSRAVQRGEAIKKEKVDYPLGELATIVKI